MNIPPPSEEASRRISAERLSTYDPTTPAEPPPPNGEGDYGFSAPSPREQPSTRFTLVRFGEIKPLDGDEDYWVKGLLPRTGLAVVWGPPKCGKSFWTFDLLMHVALGWQYRGLRVRQGPVVYVCLEGTRGFRKRKEAFRIAKMTGANEPQDPPFFLVSNPLALVRDVKTLIADIKRQVGEDVPAIVCIDTLNRSLTGSENKDEDMAAYIRAADMIRDAFDCLVRHHPPLAARRRPTARPFVAHGRARRADRREREEDDEHRRRT